MNDEFSKKEIWRIGIQRICIVPCFWQKLWCFLSLYFSYFYRKIFLSLHHFWGQVNTALSVIWTCHQSNYQQELLHLVWWKKQLSFIQHCFFIFKMFCLFRKEHTVHVIRIGLSRSIMQIPLIIFWTIVGDLTDCPSIVVMGLGQKFLTRVGSAIYGLGLNLKNFP